MLLLTSNPPFTWVKYEETCTPAAPLPSQTNWPQLPALHVPLPSHAQGTMSHIPPSTSANPRRHGQNVSSNHVCPNRFAWWPSLTDLYDPTPRRPPRVRVSLHGTLFACPSSKQGLGTWWSHAAVVGLCSESRVSLNQGQGMSSIETPSLNVNLSPGPVCQRRKRRGMWHTSIVLCTPVNSFEKDANHGEPIVVGAAGG